MSEETISYIKCPRCGNKAFKLFDPKEINEKYSDPNTRLKLLRQYQCSNKKCAYIWEVSFLETLKAFSKMRKDEGKSKADIGKELLKGAKEMRK